MQRLAWNFGKFVILGIVLLLGQVVGGMLFFRGMPAFANDGPVDTGQALLIATVVDALILVLLANAMRLRGWRLGLLLAGVLFGVQTAQSVVETIIFGRYVHMSTAMNAAVVLAALLRDALLAGAVALAWRGDARSETQPTIAGLGWKAPVIAVFYILCYFTAGHWIAWQSQAVRDYYDNVRQINSALLIVFQFGRGLCWCALAWLLVRHLLGTRWRTALLVGLAFSGFMIPDLLFPNPVMPWPVRMMHMVEVGISNLLFGFGAAWLLLDRRAKNIFARSREDAKSDSGAKVA